MKKRTFVVAGLALLASVLIAVMLSLYAASLLGPGVLHRFSLEDSNQQSLLQGSGINMSEAESGDLLADGSFEQIEYNHFLTVFSGNQDTIAVSSAEASLDGIYGDDFFVGAEARIMTLDPDGYKLKKKTTVRSYILNQPGLFQSIRLPADLPPSFQITDLAMRGQERVVAIGSKGAVLVIDNNQVQSLSYTGSLNSLIAVAADSNAVVVCSNAGELYYSTDGYSWVNIYGPEINLRKVALANDGSITAVGRQGTIVSGTMDSLTAIDSPTAYDLNSIAVWQEGWLAAGDSGVILYSQDGVDWERVRTDADVDWLNIESSGDTAIVTGSGGSIAEITMNNKQPEVDLFSQASTAGIISVLKLKNNQFIGISDNGGFLLSDDGCRDFRQSELSTGITAKKAVYTGSNRLLAIDNDGGLAYTQLVAGISFEEPLQEGAYQAGDLIYLSKSGSVSMSDGPLRPEDAYWFSDDIDLFNRKKSIGAPAGESYLEINLREQASMRQLIDRVELKKQLQDNVIRFSGWFNSTDTEVIMRVKLVGLSREAAVEFNLTAGQWRRYSHSFIIPEVWLQEEDVHIVIELAGSGVVGVDALQLSSAHNMEQVYSDDYSSRIAEMAPGIMRLSNIPIGKADAPAQAWTSGDGQTGFVFSQGSWSLHRTAALGPALELADFSSSVPWLTIDSAASDDELSNLFEYLASPVSEPYGRIRMEQGRAVPWTEAFARIYIEIADDNELLTDDRLKSAYVDWVISQISLSPYYSEIKNRLVFVDAMEYKQGLMQSSADYHASELELNAQTDGIIGMERLYSDYWSSIPRNPDKLAQEWPEILREIRFVEINNSTLAEKLAVMTYDLGAQTSAAIVSQSNLDRQDAEQFAQQKKQIETAVSILSKAAVGRSQKITRLSDSDNIFVFGAAENSTIRVIICNTDSMPATCQLVSDYKTAGSVIYKYDSSGSFIGTDKIRRNDSHITVLPGGAVYLEKLDSQ